jgi:hypothetical protein
VNVLDNKINQKTKRKPLKLGNEWLDLEKNDGILNFASVLYTSYPERQRDWPCEALTTCYQNNKVSTPTPHMRGTISQIISLDKIYTSIVKPI